MEKAQTLDGKFFAQFIQELDAPVFDIGNRGGMTDYIDFLTPDEITSPVMKGVDRFSRPFVVLKMNGKTNDKTYNLFQTFFQRYTGDPWLWMGAGITSISLLNTVGGMTSDQFTVIRDIIEGKTVNVSNVRQPGFVHIEYATIST